MTQEIGGFFELELHWREEYHAGAIKVNTGTNALEYILKARKYRKLYLPYYNGRLAGIKYRLLGRD